MREENNCEKGMHLFRNGKCLFCECEDSRPASCSLFGIMKMQIDPETAHEVVKRQVKAMKDMIEGVLPAIEEHDPKEAYIAFNFDLCQMTMANIEEWANNADS